MKTLIKKCELKSCNNKFTPKVADINRGWGKYCSKSCAAKHRSIKIHLEKLKEMSGWDLLEGASHYEDDF